jgi:metal-dependent hydrolase (beta-lactamase superfamily II)
MQNDRIHFLANRTCSQMMSFIIETAGKIIVIDGGTAGDAPHLLATLQKLTGAKVPHVDAWFFSHDHSDHVGALVQILKTQQKCLLYFRWNRR